MSVCICTYPYLSVKKGGRQFQSVILEGVTDFSASGGLGKEKRWRYFEADVRPVKVGKTEWNKKNFIKNA